MDTNIRSVDPADARAIRAIYAPFVSDSATSFETVVPDVEEIRRRIDEQRASYPWLVFESNGTIAGYAYASAHRARQAYRWSVDVSVYVDRIVHRRGIGRALYQTLFDLLRRQRFVNAYAGITLPNAASVALHESLGFEPIGVYRQVGFKFDRWHDVGWWHLRLMEHPRCPADPLLPEQAWGDPSVTAMLRERANGVRLA
jgi:L-amino acid N-acyltransferase YncA